MSKPHILIVDDSREILSVLELGLEDHVHVHNAHTYEEGLSVLDAHPDITHVFIDFYLIGETGFKLLKTVKANYPTLLVIMMSSHYSVMSAAPEAKLADGLIDKMANFIDAILSYVTE